MKLPGKLRTWSWYCCVAFLVGSGVTKAQDAGGFSALASALPFPPDAQKVEFDATFDDIEFTSASSLGALIDFYRREMAARGWTEDADAAEMEDDGAELTFEHGGAKVVAEFDQRSEGVQVSFDCDGIDFTGTDDPAALVKSGVPQPRAYVFLQNDIPRPDSVQDVHYKFGDACHFKSQIALQPAFDFFGKALKGAGWKESRKPIITADRRYTEFKRGPITVGVNIFSDAVGSRIILDYENTTKEKVVPPLAPVKVAATTPGETPDAPTEEPAATADEAPSSVDVASNQGSAAFTLGAEKYAFKYVAAFRTKEDGAERTRVVFSERPIPFQKMQSLLAKDDDFSFHDLYDFDAPSQVTLTLGEYCQFYFYSGGTNISTSVDKEVCTFTVENGRVRGEVKMTEAQEFFDDKYLLTATFDAGILTPTSKIGGKVAPDKLAKRESPVESAGPLLPEGVEGMTSEGTPYCKTTHATVIAELPAIVAFYREQLAADGWKEEGDATEEAPATLSFKKEGAGAMTIALQKEGDRTVLDIVSRDDAKAKADGMMPEAGKGRIVLGNAFERDIVIMIGKQSYPMKAGQGAEDAKTARNYTVAPGKYALTIKLPGKPPQPSSVAIVAGETWGVVVLPTGDAFTTRIYWSEAADTKK